MAVEEPAAVARVGGIHQDVVPACGCGGVAFVVAFEVPGYSADRAREAEADADHAFEHAERARIRRDPDRILAVLGLHLLEVVGDHRRRLVPTDALPFAGAALADALVRVLDALGAVQILKLRHAAQADARRIGLGDRLPADRRLVVRRAFDKLHLAVGHVDKVTTRTVTVVRMPGADELLGRGRGCGVGLLQAAQEELVCGAADDGGRSGSDGGSDQELAPVEPPTSGHIALLANIELDIDVVVGHVSPPLHPAHLQDPPHTHGGGPAGPALLSEHEEA